MDTKNFLAHVLPRGGLKIIAVLHPYTDSTGQAKNGWRYSTYHSAEAMAEAAQQLDAKGHTVFFALQGYNDWYTDEETGKKRIRTQDNVVAIKSLYDDFDVSNDAKKNVYKSREEALAGVKLLATTLKLSPTVTSSGGGFHFYLTCEEDLTPEQWKELSELKRSITSHLELKVDRAVDLDSARVLRPVGTHNRKKDTPRPVELLRVGKQYSYKALKDAFLSYIDSNNLSVHVQPKDRVANPFAAALDTYPPSSATTIATHCDALKRIAEVKGNVSEPAWRAMVGLVKHCIEGDKLIHEWSSGHPNYDPVETQNKIDNWRVNPTTCDQFDECVQCKANCQYKDKIRSPIRLGYAEEAPSVEETPKPKEQHIGVFIDGEHIPFWPSTGYRWGGKALERSSVDADGVVSWHAFCRVLAFPIKRVREEDGTWSVVMRARETNGDWREFCIASGDIASPDMLAKALGQYEVFLHNTRTAKANMSEWLKDYLLGLQQQRVGVTTISRFGWDENGNFAIGSSIITPKEVKTALCGKTIPKDWNRKFVPSGTLESWIAMTDRLANRPGAEIVQFQLCHSFGAPLVWLMGDSDWHGIPFGIVGPSGSGKSTIASLGSGIYGPPSLFSSQGTDAGTSINAAVKRLSLMNGLPYVFDELSGRDPREITAIVYAAGNGKEKERLRQDGNFATTATPWFTHTTFTSNDSLYSMLAQNKNEFIVDGTQLRVFEVTTPPDYIGQLWHDIDRTEITEHKDTNYGHAGVVYLDFILKNKDWVRTQLMKARRKFNPQSTDETKERFYRDALVTNLVAGKIAQKLGLIRFDLAPMVRWAERSIELLRVSRQENKTDIGEQLASFVSSLHGRMIVTKELRDGRSEGDEQPMEQLRGTPIGRIAIEAKKVFIHVKAVSDWCKEHGVQLTAMRNKMDEMGLLLYTDREKPSHVVRIGTGSTVISSPARCYELNYNLLLGTGSALRLVPSQKEKAK